MINLLKIVFLSFAIALVNSSDPEVATSLGKIKGKLEKSAQGRTYNAFTGIPYAKPPVGELRFKPPVPVDAWKGTLTANKGQSICPQWIYNYVFGSEDCLFLNVYTPQVKSSGESLLPVIFYIHGGGFIMGSGEESWYGADLFLDRDVVLVTLNYRLGALGFLTTGDDLIPGNNALKDQALALKWVKENIEAFGGDPENISTVGHSSGAACSHLLAFSPLTRGLIKRVVAQSGSAFNYWVFVSRDEVARNAKELAKLVKCSKPDDNEMVACLRNVKVDEIIKHQSSIGKLFDHDPYLAFRPIIENVDEGAFLTEYPEEIMKAGNAADVPFLTGITTDDGGIGAAGYLGKPDLIEQLDKKFGEILPRSLKYNDFANKDEITQSIREFYFKDKAINRDTQGELTDMFTDTTFGSGVDKAVRLHKKYLTHPVYYYLFGYKGSETHAKHFGDPEHDYGVCHADELLYLFTLKSLFHRYEATDSDVEMTKSLTTLWANFAKAGRPTLEDDTHFAVQWEPVSSDKMEYYFIKNGTEFVMEEGLNLQRIEFLNSLFSEKRVKDEL